MAMSTLQRRFVMCASTKIKKKERLITCENTKRELFDLADHQNVIQRHTQILGVVFDR